MWVEIPCRSRSLIPRRWPCVPRSRPRSETRSGFRALQLRPRRQECVPFSPLRLDRDHNFRWLGATPESEESCHPNRGANARDPRVSPARGSVILLLLIVSQTRKQSQLGPVAAVAGGDALTARLRKSARVILLIA